MPVRFRPSAPLHIKKYFIYGVNPITKHILVIGFFYAVFLLESTFDITLAGTCLFITSRLIYDSVVLTLLCPNQTCISSNATPFFSNNVAQLCLSPMKSYFS